MDDSFAPISPSCLSDGSNVSCTAHLLHCEQVASGILLTTNYDVHGIYRDGDHLKLSGDGSILISWDKISRVDVEGRTPRQFHRSFYPPEQNTGVASSATELLSKDMHYENMRHAWLDIYHDNHSIENDIIKRTSKEIELIKNGVIPKAAPLSIWGSFAVLVILLIVVTLVCWKRNTKRKERIFIIRV